MFGIAAAEARAHRKSGHPSRRLRHAHRIGARRNRQSAEARFFVEIEQQAVDHFDRQSADRFARPNHHAEARRLERRRNLRDLAHERRVLAHFAAGDLGSQCGKETRELRTRRCNFGRADTGGFAFARPKPEHFARLLKIIEARRRRQIEPRGHIRPDGGEIVADQENAIGAHARLIGGGDELSGLTQNVDVAQKDFAVHMVIGAAQFLGERNGGARTLDIGAEPRHQRQAGLFEQTRSGGGGRFERGRRSVDKNFHLNPLRSAMRSGRLFRSGFMLRAPIYRILCRRSAGRPVAFLRGRRPLCRVATPRRLRSFWRVENPCP